MKRHRDYREKPRYGETVFLVYGKCDTAGCDFWMAAPEGSAWPACPKCGVDVSPPYVTTYEAALSRHGFAAHFLQEIDAYNEVYGTSHRVSPKLRQKPLMLHD